MERNIGIAATYGSIPQMGAALKSAEMPTEGRFAIVTNVGQGMRWTRAARLTKCADADGEVVWS